MSILFAISHDEDVRKEPIFLLTSLLILIVVGGYSFVMVAKESPISTLPVSSYLISAPLAKIEVDPEDDKEAEIILIGVTNHVVALSPSPSQRADQLRMKDFLTQWNTPSRPAVLVYDERKFSHEIPVLLEGPRYDAKRNTLIFNLTFQEGPQELSPSLKHIVLYVQAL